METNNIINIPEGYEIDKEKSNEHNIVLKKIEDKRVRSWEEYCEKMKGKKSYYLGVWKICDSHFEGEPILSEFEDKEDVEALVAFCKLRKMRKQWIGEWEPDWTNDESKYTIINEGNLFVSSLNVAVSNPMSFPTEKMRDEFIETFKDLLEIAKPLL